MKTWRSSCVVLRLRRPGRRRTSERGNADGSTSASTRPTTARDEARPAAPVRRLVPPRDAAPPERPAPRIAPRRRSRSRRPKSPRRASTGRAPIRPPLAGQSDPSAGRRPHAPTAASLRAPPRRLRLRAAAAPPPRRAAAPRAAHRPAAPRPADPPAAVLRRDVRSCRPPSRYRVRADHRDPARFSPVRASHFRGSPEGARPAPGSRAAMPRPIMPRRPDQRPQQAPASPAADAHAAAAAAAGRPARRPAGSAAASRSGRQADARPARRCRSSRLRRAPEFRRRPPLAGSRPADLSRTDPSRPADGGQARRASRRPGAGASRRTASAASDLASAGWSPGLRAASRRTAARPSRRSAPSRPATARAHGRREDPAAAAPARGIRAAADQPRDHDLRRHHGEGAFREARREGRPGDEEADGPRHLRGHQPDARRASWPPKWRAISAPPRPPSATK